MISCVSQAINLANKNELGHPRRFSEEEQAKQLIIRDVVKSGLELLCFVVAFPQIVGLSEFRRSQYPQTFIFRPSVKFRVSEQFRNTILFRVDLINSR
ncbi:hypothetical protein, partial [Subsaximicrobium wynnwilliamsii]|uniref:hypothetical protein n=1 Tax=Subsaximicrobium wynnwilliamsii TaxID=291179 RepID=UPI001CB8A44B